MVLVDNHMVSMIVSELRVLSVTHLMLHRVFKGMRMAGRMGGDRVKDKEPESGEDIS